MIKIETILEANTELDRIREQFEDFLREVKELGLALPPAAFVMSAREGVRVAACGQSFYIAKALVAALGSIMELTEREQEKAKEQNDNSIF